MDTESLEQSIEVDDSLSLTPNSSPTSSKKAALKSVIAGATAGVVTALVCAPLDIIKIRMQTQGSLGMHAYGGNTSGMLRKIYVEEGAAGMFKGLGPALLSVPIFWAVYWPLYTHNKIYFAKHFPDASVPVTHLMSAVVAGAVGDVITNPFWVTRTRLQTLIFHPEAHLQSNIGTFEMMRTIYQQEGLRSFYKGLAASFLGLSHVAIQFPLCKIAQ
jgi:solute carrier family 25 folate transporter 32